jgi:hypothetical protein
MRTRTFTLTLCILLTTTAYAQVGRNSNWYFGTYAAVSFNSGTPVAVSGSAMSVREGNATMSDASGNLLFYTNGMTVWNSTHVPMFNGTGLMSDIYATQSSVILPMPGFPDLYYLFTMNTWEFAATDLRYSIIDMTLDGGLGAVTATKNILVNDNVREQLTAVRHMNGIDYWILVHEAMTTNFLAYKLTSAGLDTVPVISSTGMAYTGWNRFGGLRFSHDCRRLVSVLGNPISLMETVQIYDFSPSTGIIFNPITVAMSDSLQNPYSAEFSPDNRKLYVTSYNANFVYQFDLLASDIPASRVDITNGAPGVKCSVLKGPDDKIYVGMESSSNLSVINYPNLSGLSCGYQQNALSLGSGHPCRLGLPNTITYSCWSETTSITDAESSDGFMVYPNPVMNGTSLLITGLPRGFINSISKVEIYNVLGECIFSKKLHSTEQTLHSGNLSAGMYMVQVSNGTSVSTRKLVVE